MSDNEEIDNWSLKGKQNVTDMKINEKYKSCFVWYFNSDIETLRQKLLDDLRNEWEAEEGTLDWLQIKDIINKRFGVEK